ncbi:uncharacterized protein LOC142786693 isoform X2 [Rhipicephalus microplus]|uniref:uncharacterized protein LOC142786693 isoform X2 n=1 Tax=Rhipicephalus microplus TaxID=6941 RepID=UPI003F6CD85D
MQGCALRTWSLGGIAAHQHSRRAEAGGRMEGSKDEHAWNRRQDVPTKPSRRTTMDQPWCCRSGGPEKEKPPSAVLTVPEASEISTHKTDTTSNVSLTVGAVSSISAKENGRSDTHASECSSLAPYWIPEQIKHYFRHRHSQEEEDSSGKTDVALRAIGLERELPAIDDSSSSRWVQLDWCRHPQHALAATLGVMTGLLLGLLLAAVVADVHIALPGSRSRAGRLASPGDFLMPNQKVNNKQAATPEDIITVRSPEGAEVTASAGVEDVPPSEENATQIHSPAFFRLPGSSKWAGLP